MSGAGTPSTTQSLTGNLNIDGLLSGTKWNASSITYSNPDSSSDYQVGYLVDHDRDGINVLNDGFGQINGSQLIALQSALDSARFGTFAPGGGVFAVEGFTNLQTSFSTSGSGNATIRVANATDETVGPNHPDEHVAYALYPGTTNSAGDIFINSLFPDVLNPTVGSRSWRTMLHEVGHALGLKHGHEGGIVLPYNVDGQEFSVMTYRTFIGSSGSGSTGAYSAPQTFMQLDILALQTMYSANYNTNSTNTTYTWNPANGTMSIDGLVALDPDDGTSVNGNKIFATLWDGGGQDTYDLSNFTTAVNIDLAPGAFSTIDPNRLADLGGSYARGNLANALLFNGDTRSLIENANGGSANDTIKGNQGDNILAGNGGNDTLYGYAGGDFLQGGDGNDILDGGTGSDLMSGGNGNDTYYIDSYYDTVAEAAGAGTDKAYSSASYEYVANVYVEETELTGTAGNYLYGNNTDQKLIGNSGNNRLDGRTGSDILVGGAGSDTFAFSTAYGFTNVDNILDFSTAQDKIELSRSFFANLNAGSTLSASAFVLGTGPLDTNDRVIYDSSVGYLSYDADGTGSAYYGELFATVTPGTSLSASNFVLVA